MKKHLTLFQKILLSIITAMLLITLSDLFLQYFFDISLSYGFLIIPFAVLGITSFYVFFPRKKLFAFILFAVFGGFTLVFYNITKSKITSRKSITGSKYIIEVNPRSYSIIKQYNFAEKIVTVKNSDIFFNPNSKTAIDLGYKVKLLKETQDSLSIEINSQIHKVDHLKKRRFWEKH